MRCMPFLRRRLDSGIYIDGSLLVLTEEQAGAVLALAYKRNVGEIAGTVSEAKEAS